MTDLPVSEAAFEEERWESSITLSEALIGNGASRLLSSFSGVLVAVTLLGRNFMHIHRYRKDDSPEDPEKEEFWLRHREIDRTISATFSYLPEHLKLPQALRDQDVVLFHMCLHVSTICLHQASVVATLEHRLEASYKTQSMDRCVAAADEITNVMKMISHFDASNVGLSGHNISDQG